MIIDPIRFSEQEYQQPFAEIVAGYSADQQPIGLTADILHVEPAALEYYSTQHGITFAAATQISKPSPARKQSRRKRSPHYQFNGLSLTPIEWEEITGINSKTIRMRINRGWDTTAALSTPPLDIHQRAARGVAARRRNHQ